MPTTRAGRMRGRGLAALAVITSVTLAALSSPTFGLPNVAVLGSPGDLSWNDDVQAKLLATGQFGSVDVFNIAAVTPSLAQMQNYCGLLVYTDGPGFADEAAFGNTLADYVDAGGGVVTAVFATASIPIFGRFDTDNYWAIQPTFQTEGNVQTLGAIHDPGHPILAGVSSFSGGQSSYRPGQRSIHPSATAVADWTGPGDIPLIATRFFGLTRRADLGFFPPSDDIRSDFWDSTTDGALIMANALTWVCATSNCGDGLLDSGEQCDDGNTGNGDGCSGICRVEPCYACAGAPSMCSSLPDGASCNDGLFCNGADTCSGAACTVHPGDPCTGGVECNNVCNEANNSCAATAGTPCLDDGNVCTGDQCNGAGTCIHPETFFTPCDDGLFCNGADTCLFGDCQLHDGDPCAFNECALSCDEMTGTCDPRAPGTPCSDDGDVCTNDQCDGAGACAHPPGPSGVPCPDDGNDCTTDQCDGAGMCGHPSAAAGAPCTDDANDCTDDRCDGANACVHAPRMNGAACDDADGCTQTDQCQGGSCVGSNPVVCTTPLCHAPTSCDADTGTCTSCPAGYTPGNGGCQQTYAIGVSLLDNLGTFCDGTGANRYNGCSASPFGFHWTDTGDTSVGAVTRVDVEIHSGLECGGGTHTVRLNTAMIGVYAATAAACDCVPPRLTHLLADVNASTYVKGGSNSVSISDTNCAGLSADPEGRYAIVTVTYEDLGAPLAVQSGCRAAQKSSFRYRDNGNDPRDKMRWKWGKGDATSQAEFADPSASTDYQLCVFAESGGPPALLLGANVPASATLWRPVGSSGYKYGDVAAAAGGMKRILLRGGALGKSKLLVKGQGAQLGDPALPLALDLSGIRVQLTNTSSGVCWESEFPLNTITADDRSIKAAVR